MRPTHPVVGRKNYYGKHAEWSAHLAYLTEASHSNNARPGTAAHTRPAAPPNGQPST